MRSFFEILSTCIELFFETSSAEPPFFYRSQQTIRTFAGILKLATRVFYKNLRVGTRRADYRDMLISGN